MVAEKSFRVDDLPMDRRTTGLKRPNVEQGFLGRSSSPQAVFERRDVDPTSPVFKRRHGSVRKTNTQPNLLGITSTALSGSQSKANHVGDVRVDRDFYASSPTSGIHLKADKEWTLIFSVALTAPTSTIADQGFPVFQFLIPGETPDVKTGIRAYIIYDGSSSFSLKLYDSAHTSGGVVTHTIGGAGNYHIAVMRHTDDKISFYSNDVGDDDPGELSDKSGSTFFAGGDGTGTELAFLGQVPTAAAANSFDTVVLANAMLYDTAMTAVQINGVEADTTPADVSAIKLLWHETFNNGGDLLTYEDSAQSVTTNSYLAPTLPTASDSAIHFGGKGTAEIPYYLDFDIFYWTPGAQSVSLEWIFQIELTLPAILEDATVFEFERLCRLEIYTTGGNKRFKATLHTDNDTAGAVVAYSGADLAGGQTYQLFIGRSADEDSYIQLGVNTTPTGSRATADLANPLLYDYKDSLNFIIGAGTSTVTPSPFRGKIKRFVFTESSTLQWHEKRDSIFYYDDSSIVGDELRDLGPRSIHGVLGTRIDATAPEYTEGPIPGGSYVAATGGYTFTNFSPDITYTGRIKKAILKDVTAQRVGDRAFFVSNQQAYIANDTDKTFRPLGLPRPATKVSCIPTGIGPIDGVVAYGYRWVTKDGTPGPTFRLDPLDARGSVNVFLGAVNGKLPPDSPFGLTWGECQGSNEGDPPGRGDASASTNESFVFFDKKQGAEATRLLHDTTAGNDKTITAEVALRLPEVGDINVQEEVWEQGVERVKSSGVCTFARNENQKFKEWGSNDEHTWMFAFRYDAGPSPEGQGGNHQVLFGVGSPNQSYYAGGRHYRCPKLMVSIQPASNEFYPDTSHSSGTPTKTVSLVVQRWKAGGSKHATADNKLKHEVFNYAFIDGRDYCVIVRRAASLTGGQGLGQDLVVSIFDKQEEEAAAGKGWVAGWGREMYSGGNNVAQRTSNFWAGYTGNKQDTYVFWGCMRQQGRASKVRGRGIRQTGGACYWGEKGIYLPAMPGGTRWYHSRYWYKDFPFPVYARNVLKRYGARNGPLKDKLKSDIAWCPDSSVSYEDGGWDSAAGSSGMSIPFFDGQRASGKVNLRPRFLELGNTPLFCWGYDATDLTPNLNKIPFWLAWSNRNEGSIAWGVGDSIRGEIGKRKWYTGSQTKLFTDFKTKIDLSQWTWFTFVLTHFLAPNSATALSVYFERIFIDGNSGEWGAKSWAAGNALYKADNATGNTNELFCVGSPDTGADKGLDSKYQVEFAEARVWDGDYYKAPDASGGKGTHKFEYLNSRVPPPLWDRMWHYGRFAFLDTNDPDDPDTATAMDNKGLFDSTPTGSASQQLGPDGITIQNGAEVVDSSSSNNRSTNPPPKSSYTAFPTVPPLDDIRGIEIFRTNVVPVEEFFIDPKTKEPGTRPNPYAIVDAWRVARSAPLRYVAEIPRGTTHYLDTASDAGLGAKLDLESGQIVRNPNGAFEWAGHIGLFNEDIARIYFSESPTAWDSYPKSMVFDLPLREFGPVQAGAELASGDARKSRALVLGKSWGAFIDGSPTAPQANSLGGGVGASNTRCLVVEQGIAYAYNGTLWAISGTGQVEDIGLPVLDLLPDPDSTRLSVSSTLSSLFVINESSGLCLRYHFAQRQWYVEDRYAYSVTDITGADNWVHLSGYPAAGNTSAFQDDVESGTPALTDSAPLTVSSYDNDTNTLVIASNLESTIKVGQRLLLTATAGGSNVKNSPLVRQVVKVSTVTYSNPNSSIVVDAISGSGGLALDDTDTNGETYVYHAVPGVGEWGTMLDTGQFGLQGNLKHVDVGISAGDRWFISFDASDFAKHPTDRTGFDAAESLPTHLVDSDGDGASARWGANNTQRMERLIIWAPSAESHELTEVVANYTAG